jgi:stress response protein YsnF
MPSKEQHILGQHRDHQEANVGKHAVPGSQHVSATVRKDMVDVDAQGNPQVTGPDTERR